MLRKTVEQMLAEANQLVPAVTPQEAMQWLNDNDTLLLDVRPASAIADTGTVEGSVVIPRGLLEFKADPSFLMHDPVMDPEKRVVIFCTAGGQAALAGQTLKTMGYDRVFNGGGLEAWKDAGASIVHPSS